MKHLKALMTAAAVILTMASCSDREGSRFTKVVDGRFERDGKEVSFVGTNMWYGPILGSEGRGGNRERLVRELDELKSLGVTNLRVLVGADGPEYMPARTTPVLQPEPGVYNDTLLVGLDYFLAELGKRDMQAVLFLSNAWSWSGGFNVYLQWASAADSSAVRRWGIQPSEFYKSRDAQQMYFNHIRNIVTRRNTVTGKLYEDDPAIFSWQLANEPRPFSREPAVTDAFCNVLAESAALIKSLDPNHMVSTGNEGAMGCNDGDLALARRLNTCPDIDYVTIHIWPMNWSWVHKETLDRDFSAALLRTDSYIDEHEAFCRELGKPMVIEEFGFPRDGGLYDDGTPTTLKDRYYKHVFDRLLRSRSEGGALAGVNFWAWSGFAVRPVGRYESRQGDDYFGDPGQEAPGLYSVFVSDAGTIGVIREATAAMDAPYARALVENDWILGKDKPLRFDVHNVGKTPSSLTVRLSTDKGEPVGEWSETVPKDGIVQFAFDLTDGFYKVESTLDGRPVRDFVVGIGNPEKVVSEPDKADDFDDFWEKSLNELAAVDPQYRLTELPEHSNDVRKAYRVDMMSWGGEPISALLMEPVKEGKFPVFINYLGYNCDPWYEDPSDNPETIKVWLCTRRQGFNRDLSEPADFTVRGLESPGTYYYHGAFLDVVRGVDLACSRPKADLTRVFAEGGSQGGAFTLIAAALDPRIKAIAAFVPFLSDYPDYFKVASWPGNEILPAAKRLGISDGDLYHTLSYCDVKNFTDRIHCPVLMGFGLQDDTCPPHTNFAGYNNIPSTTEKSWICFPLSGHHVELEPGWNEARNAFFARYCD
ncbi:MAG: acetylxylan esterase [Bacteroidales bacterium]|nr:acetylxylan esterase [Bacteroidales bacterium]